MRRMIAVAGLAALLSACSQDTVRTEDKVTTESNNTVTGMVEVDLAPQGISARMMVPDKQRTGVDPTIRLDDVTNHVNIRCGKNYNVLVREEPMDLEMIKADLVAEVMFKNEIVIEQPECILFKQTLPDDSESFHHFATVVERGGTTYVVRSYQMGSFSRKQAERMMESSLTLRAGQPLAQK